MNQYEIAVTVFCPHNIRTNISFNALTGNGLKFGKMDREIENGMSSIDCAYIMMRGIFNRETEMWICSYFYGFLISILRMFPSLSAKYLLKKANSIQS